MKPTNRFYGYSPPLDPPDEPDTEDRDTDFDDAEDNDYPEDV